MTNDKERGVLAWGPRLLRILGSFGLACVILLLLTLLTFMGTLEQAHASIYDVQREYFESAFLISDVLGIPIPMPGAYLLLALLFVNLVVGGMIRLKRKKNRAGIFVVHLGVALLLIGGFIEFTSSTKGYLPVLEGEPFKDRNGNEEYDPGEPFADRDGNGVRTPPHAGARFLSHYDRDLVVRMRAGENDVREWLVPMADLAAASHGQRVQVTLEGGPTFQVHGYRRNAAVKRGRGEGSVDGRVIVGLGDDPKNAEANMPACYVSLPLSGGKTALGLVSAEQEYPFVAGMGRERVTLDVKKRGWDLPFAVSLRRGIEKTYPGTSKPSEFSSYITKIEDGVREHLHITMNEPLRHRGYTLYQSGMSEAVQTQHGPRMMSTFSVVKNPADSVPLLACIVIVIGMLMHFCTKLARFILRELGQPERKAEATS